jgi:glycosyltransferase involved in cell wall biosynthesis
MVGYAIQGLIDSEKWRVHGLIHPDNIKNRHLWEQLRTASPDRFSINTGPTRTTKFQAVRRHFQRAQLGELLARINAYAPDLILVIQGNIEQACSVFSLKGQLVAPLVSYIPLPHKHAEMGAKFGALRDLSCHSLYGVPDGFITISKTLGEMLKAYGATGRIEIVENGIPLQRFKHSPSQSAARVQLGLPHDGFIWGHMGRVEFKQKGQDFSLQSFLSRESEHPEECLAFLGSGPDSAVLEASAVQSERVHCLPWSDDPLPFLAAIDALILPSRYEGVPLVMLEALANSVPVVATDRDGMCDWLPAQWRFTYRSDAEVQRAMNAVKKVDPTMIASLHDKIWQKHSVTEFQFGFTAALSTWL